MTVVVRSVGEGEASWEIRMLRPHDTVRKLKEGLSQQANIPVAEQQLIFSGEELIDNATLDASGMLPFTSLSPGFPSLQHVHACATNATAAAAPRLPLACVALAACVCRVQGSAIAVSSSAPATPCLLGVGVGRVIHRRGSRVACER